MKVTAMELEQQGACKDQVKWFRELFGEGPVTITAALCAEHPKVDYDWAARHLLPPDLGAEYERQRAPLRATARKRLCGPSASARTRLCGPSTIAMTRLCSAPLLSECRSEVAAKGGNCKKVPPFPPISQ